MEYSQLLLENLSHRPFPQMRPNQFRSVQLNSTAAYSQYRLGYSSMHMVSRLIQRVITKNKLCHYLTRTCSAIYRKSKEINFIVDIEDRRVLRSSDWQQSINQWTKQIGGRYQIS